MASLRASGALGLVANDGQSSADVEGGTVASDLESPSPSSDLLPESAAAAHKVYDRRQTIDWAHGTAGNGLEEHLDHVDAQLAAVTQKHCLKRVGIELAENSVTS